MNISVSVKTALAFYLSIIFFPFAHISSSSPEFGYLVLAVLSELFLGLIAGLALQIIFASVALAGEQISMVMGFSKV